MYDQYYGLSGRPFQLTPDPHYYFESGTHRKALSYLGYGLAQGEGFIVITGEVGSGKSTLVSHLMQTIDKARLTAATIVTSQLDAVDLVQMTAESFGIDTRGMDKAAALKAIENFLHAEARAGRRCLLVVDEAQNLTVDALEELRMLSNFQLGSTALLQIFLLGQPEFRNLLQTAPELEQLRQRVIATHHLEAMDADEVQPYIEHRLKCAGWTGRPQLTADAYDALYNETGGVPRKLNAVMNRCLLMGAVEQTDTIDGALVGAVIVDMNGKPFEYDATMASQAPFAEPVATKTAPVAAMAQPVVAAADTAHYQALASRIDQLEARMASQDVTMRRVLAMLIDWMEKENQSLAARMRDMRAA
ncbi:XrtA/PEP-CTERM system-associated ATPase [Sphingorhabdus sp.]|uniref:XrtA/PEP-CTERM system-associated ATPase n=1 Tax=Sphingorhabdus sp. TaxID=1902408 RepID=UPI0032B717EB